MPIDDYGYDMYKPNMVYNNPYIWPSEENVAKTLPKVTQPIISNATKIGPPEMFNHQPTCSHFHPQVQQHENFSVGNLKIDINIVVLIFIILLSIIVVINIFSCNQRITALERTI
jgi:hypothetical protein